MDGLGWQRQRGQQDEDSGMRVALVNPHWSFEGSIYFGCREPHLPLELGCAAALLEAAGHESLLLDGALMGLDNQQLRSEEHTSELQSLMRISYAVFCWKKKQKTRTHS